MNTYLYALLLLPVAACKKEEAKKDEYFFCTVNDSYVNLNPKRSFSYATIPSGAPKALFEYDRTRLNISASDEEGHSVIFSIADTVNKVATGTYKLSINYVGSSFMNFMDKGYYYTDSIHTGVLNLTVTSTYIKGSFSATLKHEDKEEVIQITNGQFRLPYSEY